MNTAFKQLVMLSELHFRGYHLLRLLSGAPHGVYHLGFTTKNNLMGTPSPQGSLVQVANVVNWNQVLNDIPITDSEEFLAKYPEVASAGHGRDWAYVGWYTEMLAYALSRETLPVFYSDHGESDTLFDLVPFPPY